MTIYFDENHEPYYQLETLQKWGKTLTYQCKDAEYQEFLSGKKIWQDNELVLNPDYEAEQALQERERINKLTVTKRVFALALEQFGVTYTQLKEVIASNERAQLEWDLCVELERGNSLLDQLAPTFNITSEQLDYIFKAANGEIEENMEGINNERFNKVS